MNVLCIGDIVGRPGREALEHLLGSLKEEFFIDLTVVNAENAAGGAGITSRVGKFLFSQGCDVLTLGDHTWDKKEAYEYLDEESKIVRPANFPEGAPGQGFCITETKGGQKVGIINLLGRTFMRYNVDCPFTKGKALIDEISKQTPFIVVDFHGEATSEKIAFAHYCDGLASIVFGTHTHIQTADEKIFPKGTAYISDLGMTGPYDSVIGQNKDRIIERFLTALPQKFEVATDNVILHGVVVEIDDAGKASSIQRIQRPFEKN